MTNILDPIPELSDLYFTPNPLVTASPENLKGKTRRTLEIYYMERLGPNYQLPYTRFPAALYENLTHGKCPLLTLLERYHPDWIYRHYVLIAHSESPENALGMPDIFFHILLEDYQSGNLLLQFFRQHQGADKVAHAFTREVAKQSERVSEAYRHFRSHQNQPSQIRYFKLNPKVL